MRRGSVVGPLILILIGGSFLINNLRPDFSVLDMIGRYWPFLLILWGVLRLAEVLWSFSRGSVSGSGLSAGEWTLLILFCVFGSAFFFAREHIGSRPWVRLRGMEFFGEPYDYSLDQRTASAARASRIIVENFRGNTHITGANTADVKVSGRKTVRAMQQGEADEANRVTPLEIIQNGDSILIRTNQEKWRRDQFVTADLEVTVPKGLSVETRGRYGDVDVNDLNGSVEVSSDNAGVRVQNIAGNFRVNTRKSDIIRAIGVKGDVELKGRGNAVELDGIGGQVLINGTYSGELDFRNLARPLRYDAPQTNLRVERCPGQIRMARGYLNGEDVIGPVILRANSKDVQLAGFTQSIDLHLDRGDVELRPGKLPLPKMDIVTRSGHVELALPEGAKFALKASVGKGEVQNEFGSPLQVSNEGRGGTIIGTVGDGPEISLSSDRGSVTVRKASGADIAFPLRPAPSVPPRARIEEIMDRHIKRIGKEVDRIKQQTEQEADRLSHKF